MSVHASRRPFIDTASTASSFIEVGHATASEASDRFPSSAIGYARHSQDGIRTIDLLKDMVKITLPDA